MKLKKIRVMNRIISIIVFMAVYGLSFAQDCSHFKYTVDRVEMVIPYDQIVRLTPVGDETLLRARNVNFSTIIDEAYEDIKTADDCECLLEVNLVSGTTALLPISVVHEVTAGYGGTVDIRSYDGNQTTEYNVSDEMSDIIASLTSCLAPSQDTDDQGIDNMSYINGLLCISLDDDGEDPVCVPIDLGNGPSISAFVLDSVNYTLTVTEDGTDFSVDLSTVIDTCSDFNPEISQTTFMQQGDNFEISVHGAEDGLMTIQRPNLGLIDFTGISLTDPYEISLPFNSNFETGKYLYTITKGDCVWTQEQYTYVQDTSHQVELSCIPRLDFDGVVTGTIGEWYLLDDASHSPINIDSITSSPSGNGFTLHHSGIDASKVAHIQITPDETYRQLGISAGVSAGVDSTVVSIFYDHGWSFQYEYNGSSWVFTNYSGLDNDAEFTLAWVSNYLDVDGPQLYGQGVSYGFNHQALGTTRWHDIRSQGGNSTGILLSFFDEAGTIRGTPDVLMRGIIERRGRLMPSNTHLLSVSPGANFWISGKLIK